MTRAIERAVIAAALLIAFAHRCPRPSTPARASALSCPTPPPRTGSDPRSLSAVDRGVDGASSSPASEGRRRALRRISSFAAMLSSSSGVARPADAASSELFRPNPLTNPVLEQMRIWNQDEADNIRYGGELESGSAKPAAFEQYVHLLRPILEVERNLDEIDVLLSSGNASSKEDFVALYERVDVTLSKPLFDKVNFKKTFNHFADNIYYSDPDRANLYLGGGAMPKTTQSIAYLLRNDVLTNVEDMRAEAKYLLRELEKFGSEEMVTVGQGGLETGDMLEMSKSAKVGMGKYLGLVPPGELKAARESFDTR